MSRFYAPPTLLLLVVSVGLQISLQSCMSSASPPTTPGSPPPSRTSSPSTAPVSSPRFQVHILNQHWVSGYTRESVWPTLKEMNWEEHVWVITEDDIEAYDWSQQTITMTHEATTQLKNSIDDEMLARWVALKQLFVVTYDNEWLYGGVFSEQGSAAGIQFPVIWLDYYEKEQFVLHVRPDNGWWPLPPTQDRQGEVWDAIQNPEVRALFADRGTLVE